MNENERLLHVKYAHTSQQIADAVGYTREYISALAKAGEIPAIKRGREWRFDLEEVEAVLYQNSDTSTSEDDEHGSTSPDIRDLLC